MTHEYRKIGEDLHDGDGHLNIVVSNDAPDRKLLYLNDEKGQFTEFGNFGRSVYFNVPQGRKPRQLAVLPVVVASLGPEGAHWIYARSAPCGNQTCRSGGKQQS